VSKLYSLSARWWRSRKCAVNVYFKVQ